MTDWTPLAHDDPVAGDPDGIAATGRRFLELAEALDGMAGRVLDVDPESVWAGLAAERFASARDRLPVQVRALARRLRLAGEALQRWSVAGIAAMRALPDGETWAGPDWHAALADALDRLADAHRRFDDVVARYRDAAARASRQLAEADEVLDDPAWAVGPLAAMASRLLTAPRSLSFVATADGLALNTPDAWQWETYRQAGIDPTRWDPSLGLAPLDGVAVDAWAFYAELFDRRPEQFLWAGMATLAGGTFYAAFQDVHVLRRALESGSVRADEVGELFRRLYPGLPGPVLDEISDLAARDMAALAAEVRYVEVRFLDMQRQIFDDLAWQHVAFEHGGLPAMEQLHDDGKIDLVHVRAWRDIASGDYARTVQGNRALLRHEQEWIIGDDYDTVRGHSPVTWAMTMGMSVVAHSPVPGGRPFREVVPYELTVDTPDRWPLVPDWAVPDRVPFTDVGVPGGRGLYVDTPDHVEVASLPVNNVSIFANRWAWIEGDMLPAWVDHIEDGTAAALVAQPLADQAARQRLLPDNLLPYEPEE